MISYSSLNCLLAAILHLNLNNASGGGAQRAPEAFMGGAPLRLKPSRIVYNAGLLLAPSRPHLFIFTA
jgi:hypothetical protein